jgi:imidazolonepropionase-like amidohydrolase
MQKSKAVMVTLLLAGGALASLGALAPAQSAHDHSVLVVRGAQILPITAPRIAQGVLVIKDGKIVAVGAVGKVQIPAGAIIQDASGKIIMPGIVDSHSHIGHRSGGPEYPHGERRRHYHRKHHARQRQCDGRPDGLCQIARFHH